MKLRFLLVLVVVSFVGNLANGQEAKTEKTKGTDKFTIENCLNKIDKAKCIQTAVGYQYWFIPQNFLEDGQTVKLSVVGPNKANHAPHKHPGDELFFILEGKAQFFLNGKTTTAGPYATFYCPVGSEHGISNAGNDTLKYLVIRKYLKEEK